MGFVLDEFDLASFGVEDKDGADLLIGDIEIALGIDRHPVWLGQLPENLSAVGLRLGAGEAVHPRVFLRLGSVDLRKFFGGIKRLVADAGDGRRIWPDNVRIIDNRWRLLRLVFLLLPGRNRQRRRQYQDQKRQQRQQFMASKLVDVLSSASAIPSGSKHRSHSPLRVIVESDPYGRFGRTPCCWPGPSPADWAEPRNVAGGRSGSSSESSPCRESLDPLNQKLDDHPPDVPCRTSRATPPLCFS